MGAVYKDDADADIDADDALWLHRLLLPRAKFTKYNHFFR